MNEVMTNELVQQWIPVTDARGMRHLEARWVSLRELSVASLLTHDARAEHSAHAA